MGGCAACRKPRSGRYWLRCDEGVRVYYREPIYPRLIVSEENEDKAFQRSSEKTIRLFSETERCIGIRSSNWANRSLALDFGDGGVPKSHAARGHRDADRGGGGHQRRSNRAADELFRVPLRSPPDPRPNAGRSLRAICSTRSHAPIRRKHSSTARVSLEGATATRDLLVQQEIAKQKLASLQDELALQKEAQSHDSALEIEQLKSRLAVIEQQLLLLEAQKKLDEANKPKP